MVADEMEGEEKGRRQTRCGGVAAEDELGRGSTRERGGWEEKGNWGMRDERGLG